MGLQNWTVLQPSMGPSDHGIAAAVGV